MSVNDGPERPLVHDVWHLDGVLHDGREVRLVAAIDRPDVALYFEHLLEEHLGLTDVPPR
jgi:hypothetical protein